MLEKSFLRAEESHLTPPEYDDDYDDMKVCECYDREIPKGDYFWKKDEIHVLCESCVIDKIYDIAEIA